MLQPIETIVRTLCRWFAWVASITLAGVMLLTFADVIGRYFLNRPIGGAVDVTELAMGIIVFMAMALTTLRRGHITVDLLTANAPPAIARPLEILGLIASILFMGLFAHQLWTRVIDHIVQKTQTINWAFQIYPSTIIMAAGATLAVLTACAVLILVAANRAAGLSKQSNPID